jgi:hypothetical protein
MDKEKQLEAEEEIMEAVCGLYHWPFVYLGDSEEIMHDEKCSYCPAVAAVQRALEKT